MRVYQYLIFILLFCNFSFAINQNEFYISHCDSPTPFFKHKKQNLELGLMYASQLVFNYPYKNNIKSAGLNLKFGTDYFFTDTKTVKPFFKLTWLRSGLGYAFHGHPFLYLAPLNIGAGTAFNLNEKNTIEVSVNGGLAFIGYADFPGVDGFITPIVVPEIKYRHQRFALAIEITFRKSADPLEE